MASALVVAALATLVVTRLRRDPGMPAAATTAPSAMAPASVTAEAPQPAPTASSPIVTSQSGIVLHVVTDPPGALVKKGGFQVCDASPCDVIANPNEALDLSAEKGDQRAAAKVLAQREQTVTMKLSKSTAAAGGGGKSPGTTTGAGGGRNVAPVPMCEVVEGDLKILRPCK
jgi:hypothetical protein